MIVFMTVIAADNKCSSLFECKINPSLGERWASIPRLSFYIFSLLLGVAIG
jgi:hypothetical protein